MVSEGITRSRLPADNEVICTLQDPAVPALAKQMGNTRSAAAIELWRPKLAGAVVAIGNAPTALFRLLELIDDITFVHPKDMQDGKVPITGRDITTNLPYVAAAHLAFDHHESETIRNTGERTNHIISAKAPSAARVVYDHYGGKARFAGISDEMMAAVDKADSAQYNRDEVLNPSGWTLLNYLMDSRTGLGRFRNFRISNYQLMMDLIKYCRNHTIEQILALPDV